ncbi:glycoside hydrolase family 3 C-terminal domain-containing protein [Myceligenerans sp. TRM 65318]|uniref:Glycoside hydrolase family 3 C-terminal domain-containing protein n=2 Tax=Myceligenerans pegani TaxID=2776917 RepID=A0ABR9N5D2_9MICO|nr:glycoside hydrolase family 3 C-terminal domain-containing protein [Myceligenerans sp. TRM 65318]MBE3020559.1 glycoside hydrolase family 3 C-terminal domain-containing protein [Myceligenerans sp. TRM 65318]
MTVREKVAQLTGVLPQALGAPDQVTREKLDAALSEGIGHISGVGTAAGDAVGIARFNNEIQAYLRNHTRLGIPAILHAEALNGVVAGGYTSFPTAIGLAATWDPEKVRLMADLIRRQMTASGVRQALAPVLDVARDARWGRIHETYGEDVLLASAFGVSYVRGLQGDDLRSGVIATAKHFLGYAMTEGGQNMAATHLGPRELFDVYAAPFGAAIRLANLQSVMNSYSEIDGQPVATAPAILDDLLRGRLGFPGTVVSDYRSLHYVVHRQGVGRIDDAGAAGLGAGLDVELPGPYAYGPGLVEAIERGTVPMAHVDRSVLRTLTHKFALGLFERPDVDADPRALTELSVSGRDLSRTIADESVTMLKNDGVLPLAADVGSVAVIGPHADSVMAGFANYTHPPFLEMLRGILSGRSRMAGMEQALSDPDPATRATVRARTEELAKIDPEKVARESYGARSLYQALTDALPGSTVLTASGTGVLDEEPADIDAALDVARRGDVVVLAIGGRSAAFAGRATEGEGSDAATIDLPSRQLALVEAVAGLGKPVVVVLYMGKPYALAGVEPFADAIVTGYYPGPEGGPALAGVLTGEVSPSGKLPFTIPRHVGQVPVHHAQKVGSGQRRTDADQFTGYVDLDKSPLYPFGFGLGYTTFELSDIAVRPPASLTDAFEVDVGVRNTGSRHGAEVVQLYVSAPARSITRPERQLAAFGRVGLAPGAAERITFSVDMRQLGYSCEDESFVVDPGTYRLRVGTSSEDLPLAGEFTVTGERVEVTEPHAYLPRCTPAGWR